ncbi:MAG TPA: efflux RND transporter periplasmic adaptor subunit [Anaerolineales bacterium]|jgi:HlyD family secretion protein
MDQASPKSTSRKYWLIAALVLLVAAGAFIRLYLSHNAGQTSYQTSAAARGKLTASVGASGTIRAKRSVELNWNTSGRVESVLFGLGERVSADQVLAALATGSVPRNILLAQADLVTANQNLDTLLRSGSNTAQAMQNLADAGQSVKDAQDAYDTLVRKRVSGELISDTSDQIEQARKQLRFQEYIYDLFYAHRADGSTDKSLMIVQLTRSRQNIADLTARYNWYTSQASPITVEKALAALNLAKARQEDARREMDRMKNGPNPDDLAAARARVAAARSIVNQAHIIAPFDGTITQAQPQPGDRVSAGQLAFRLDDLSQLMVDLQISEVDINSVSIGQPVSISLDAVPEKTFQGLISNVDRSTQAGQGGVNFKVSVTITDPDEQVKPGMSAAVTITIKAVEDALLVPNQAVRMLAGQRIVYVLKDNQPVPVNIRLGASANENSQVVGGDLKEGDLIILNPPSLPTPTPAPAQ